MPPVDLGPAARRLAGWIIAVPDAALGAPTPCADTAIGDLLDHIGGLTFAFTAAATKAGDAGSQGPSADRSQLADDWRSRIPGDLSALAEAWREPRAWQGMTYAGGLEMPAEVAGLVALDEVVIHGWDLARASGQAYQCDDASLGAVHGFVAPFSEPGREASREGLFGPVVTVPADAPLLDRVLGLTGRDPGWSPT